MSQNPSSGGGCCCGPSIQGLRKITFPDGDQVGLVGLDAVMESLYKEGKPPDDSAALEIINRLREKNYISYSTSVQNLYQQALLSEYRNFYQRKTIPSNRAI
jgi:hypothetical protein